MNKNKNKKLSSHNTRKKKEEKKKKQSQKSLRSLDIECYLYLINFFVRLEENLSLFKNYFYFIETDR